MIVQVDGGNLERAALLLAGIKGGIYQAAGAAAKRAAQYGLTQGTKIITEEYAIGRNTVSKYLTTKNVTAKDVYGQHTATFSYAGKPIPILNFDVSVNSQRGVYARVLKTSARKYINRAFTTPSLTGIYRRAGAARYPIDAVFGPSAVQAFTAHPTAITKMNEAVSTKFDERIEHEITRLMNGWGVK